MRYSVSLLLLLLGASCLNEKNADLAQPSTFVRYFNGGFDENAVTVEQTPDDGFIMLSTLEVQESETSLPKFKIKLIKTDAFGNLQWTKVHPAHTNEDEFYDQASPNYVGRNLIVSSDGGYVLTGEKISSTGSYPLILMTDAEGNEIRKDTLTINGRGVALVESGPDLLLLGFNASPQASPDANMFLASVAKATLNDNWVRQYGDGTGNVTLARRLLMNSANQVVWAGTADRASHSDARIVKSEQNSQRVIFDLPIGIPASNEEGRDIAPFGFGYAIVGTTTRNGNRDIFFQRLNEDGSVPNNSTFVLRNEGDGFDEDGLAITVTQDGGLILLGSYNSSNKTDLDSSGKGGRGGQDFQLIKINAFGELQWRRITGSRDNDLGVAVRQARDGGLVVLGTTELANIKTVMLLKTDKNGEIQ
ncbi:MAG: hypothetical protein ACK5DD_00555 [Cyclobacteriaceae bacterium]|jgi:hypothetical protein